MIRVFRKSLPILFFLYSFCALAQVTPYHPAIENEGCILWQDIEEQSNLHDDYQSIEYRMATLYQHGMIDIQTSEIITPKSFQIDECNYRTYHAAVTTTKAATHTEDDLLKKPVASGYEIPSSAHLTFAYVTNCEIGNPPHQEF